MLYINSIVIERLCFFSIACFMGAIVCIKKTIKKRFFGITKKRRGISPSDVLIVLLFVKRALAAVKIKPANYPIIDL